MELAQCDWTAYFAGITREHQRLLVAIESVGRRTPVDERIDAMCEGVCTRHSLRAIAYAQHADVFEVAVGLATGPGPLLRYLVAAPRRIFVREIKAARAVVVTDAGGARTLVCLFSPQPRGSYTAARKCPVGRDHVRRHQGPEGLDVIARGRPGAVNARSRSPRARASRRRHSPRAAR